MCGPRQFLGLHHASGIVNALEQAAQPILAFRIVAFKLVQQWTAFAKQVP